MNASREKAVLELELEATRVKERLDERLEAYLGVVWAGVGLFEAIGLDVTDAQLRRSRLAAELGGRNDGLVHMTFVRKVERENLQKFLAARPSEFPLDPTSTKLDEPVYVTTHVQPETPENLATLGFNPFLDPARKPALARAARTGQASITGSLILKSDELQGTFEPSITLYAPVYHLGTEGLPAGEREEFLFGYIGASFRLADLVEHARKGNLDPYVGFQILSGPLGEGGKLIVSTPEEPPKDSMRTSQTIVISGQSWTIEFWSLPAFRVSGSQFQAPTIAILGLVLSLAVFVATFQHYRAREAREESVRQEKQRARDLEEQARLKNQFFSNMNHELRTPLNGLLGMSDLLHDTELNSQQQEYLDAIGSCGQALLDLINEVLDLSKIEAGKMTLNPRPSKLKNIFEQAFQVVRGPAQGKGLELRFEWDDNLPNWVELDGPRLRQVLVNLLGNAIKFTDQGSIVLRAKADGNEDKPRLQFEVEDSGVGISKEDQEKLFQPFIQVGKDSNTSVAGTGLGLHICREFLKMMDGSISLSSEIGSGTTFSGQIPLTIVDMNPYETNKMEADSVVLNPEIKVLVVDDNPINRRVLLLQLAKFGQEAESASTGAEAVKSVLENDFDLVFMDCQMPEMDGLEATRLIREQKPDRPFIVALTAATEDKQRQACLDSGMNFFLPKPIDFSRLNEIFAKWSV